jgi:hypothetical protein
MDAFHKKVRKKGAKKLDSHQIIQPLQSQPTDVALQKRTTCCNTSKTHIYEPLCERFIFLSFVKTEEWKYGNKYFSDVLNPVLTRSIDLAQSVELC